MWKIPFCISCKAGIVVMDSLSCWLLWKASSTLHFWRITLLGKLFLVGSCYVTMLVLYLGLPRFWNCEKYPFISHPVCDILLWHLEWTVSIKIELLKLFFSCSAVFLLHILHTLVLMIVPLSTLHIYVPLYIQIFFKMINKIIIAYVQYFSYEMAHGQVSKSVHSVVLQYSLNAI